MRNYNLKTIILTILLSFPIAAFAADSMPVDFTGVWMPTAIDPDGNRNPVFPEKLPFLAVVEDRYQDYLANYNPAVDDLTRSCLPYGMPRQMLVLAQYPIEIIQTEERLTIVVELHNDVRRIHLDNRNAPQGLLPSWMGFSSGQWDNDSILVSTSNLRELGFPRPQSTSLTVHERFRMVDGGDNGPMIELTLTMDDPEIYTAPLTVKIHYRQYENLEMGEYFCSEDLWRQSLDGRSGYIPWR